MASAGQSAPAAASFKYGFAAYAASALRWIAASHRCGLQQAQRIDIVGARPGPHHPSASQAAAWLPGLP